MGNTAPVQMLFYSSLLLLRICDITVCYKGQNFQHNGFTLLHSSNIPPEVPFLYITHQVRTSGLYLYNVCDTKTEKLICLAMNSEGYLLSHTFICRHQLITNLEWGSGHWSKHVTKPEETVTKTIQQIRLNMERR